MLNTIVALATPPIKSALGIIRLSGSDCFDIVNKMFSKQIKIKNEKNKILHGFVINKEENETIDEVVLLVYREPFSYTGENSVEIISHGSPVIFDEIIKLALKCGASLAKNGEFSFRAYLNKKLDLIQAESINDLINAETKESKNISLLSLKGESSKLIESIKNDFANLLSNIEVNIDYPEYKDIEEVNNKKIIETCKKNYRYIENLIKNGEQGRVIKQGVNVALIGKPNVGKSTILNKLIDEDKAIVSSIKGTTRDVVEGKTNIKGLLINLFDTAGIRESDNEIEEIGILKSKQKIDDADLVVFILDSSDISKEDNEVLNLIKNKKHLIVYNKDDLIDGKEKKKGLFYFSAINDDIKILKNEIYKQFKIDKKIYQSPTINSARELGILQQINENIKTVLNDIKENKPVDIIAFSIKDIYLKVLSLTGEDCDFDIASEIFKRFCVGK